jgi:hypothetical protein
MRSSLLISHRLFVAALDLASRSIEQVRPFPEAPREPVEPPVVLDWEIVKPTESRPARPVRVLRGPFDAEGR